ncbi:hypothetical protein HWV62_18914 [Athelia sp. TMB]|nr:hypothetical protein HWV62_18914 [Athelia sp. TMB]
MPPRAGSSKSTTASARPRTHAEPKTSRQQFSACGACRGRRVRCDLKEVALLVPRGEKAICTECRTRGINCVDEFGNMRQATRNLRRGRRIQQIEDIYGRVSQAPSPTSMTRSPRAMRPSIIPDLDPRLLSSPFFVAFNLQYSLLDRHDFASRYIEHVNNSRPLSIEGQLLAKALVVWAGSFGVDHAGMDMPTFQGSSPGPSTNANVGIGTMRQHLRQRTDAQVEEILTLIDVHGVLRKPTWDGVRLLLLIWPLTQTVQSTLERVTMYESTMSQIYALCTLEDPSSVGSGQGPYGDAMIRARIFMYAHVHEATTSALRGTRLVLSDDDLVVFKQTLPQAPDNGRSPAASLPSPVSPTTAGNRDPAHSAMAYGRAVHYFTPTLKLGAVCRHIHAVLTGSRARQDMDCFDDNGLREIWEGLERSWDDFERVRTKGLGPSGFSIGSENLDRFVSSWQIFIFECHNVIRKELERRVKLCPPSSQKASSSSSTPGSGSSGSRSMSSSGGSLADQLLNNYARASRKCRALLPQVLVLVQRHLSPTGVNKFFAYDAGLLKGGIYFAGAMLAKGDLQDPQYCLKFELGMDVETGIHICIKALESMQCVYVKSKELAQEIRNLCGQRSFQAAERNGGGRGAYTSYGYQYQHTTPQYAMNYGHQCAQPTGAPELPYSATLTTQPSLTPIITTNLAEITSRTPYSNWGMQTPPSTAHSQRSSSVMHDEFPSSMPFYESSDSSNIFYHTAPSELEVITPPSSFELGGVDMSQDSLLDGMFSVPSVPNVPAGILTPPFTAFFNTQ